MSDNPKWAQRWSQNDDDEMVMSDSGMWMEYAYYEYLKADCERITADNARLKAEVERLTKAGNTMAWLIDCQNEDAYYGFDPEKNSASEAWRAAKEGKQP